MTRLWDFLKVSYTIFLYALVVLFHLPKFRYIATTDSTPYRVAPLCNGPEYDAPVSDFLLVQWLITIRVWVWIIGHCANHRLKSTAYSPSFRTLIFLLITFGFLNQLRLLNLDRSYSFDFSILFELLLGIKLPPSSVSLLNLCTLLMLTYFNYRQDCFGVLAIIVISILIDPFICWMYATQYFSSLSFYLIFTPIAVFMISVFGAVMTLLCYLIVSLVPFSL